MLMAKERKKVKVMVGAHDNHNREGAQVAGDGENDALGLNMYVSEAEEECPEVRTHRGRSPIHGFRTYSDTLTQTGPSPLPRKSPPEPAGKRKRTDNEPYDERNKQARGDEQQDQPPSFPVGRVSRTSEDEDEA